MDVLGRGAERAQGRHHLRHERRLRPRGHPRSARCGAWIEAHEGRRGPRWRRCGAQIPDEHCARCATSTSHAPLRPDHALHLPRLPGGRDRGHRALPAHGDGRARDREAQPHAAGPGGGGRPAARRARLPRGADARARTSRRTCSGSRRWRSPTASRRWRARAAAPSRSSSPTRWWCATTGAFFPAGEDGDVPLGRAAARDHPEPGGEVPPRAAGGAHLVLRGRGRAATSPTARPWASRRSPPAPTCCGRAATRACPGTSTTSRSGCARWARATLGRAT